MLSDVHSRLLAVAGALMLLAACGEPPAPPLTAPPGVSPSAAGASGPVLPVPSGYSSLAPLPTGGGLPPATQPYVPPAPYVPPYVPPAVVPPVATTRTTPPRATLPTSTVPPAARCTSAGPTRAQMLAVLDGLPGIPQKELAVVDGPFCSGAWQFAAVRIAGEAKAEELFVVTTGPPAALKVIEAGTDVCSTEVQTGAPPGIRVRACGV